MVTHWLIFPYPVGLLHWHCGNLTIAPVPAKQPCWIWINTSCEFIMNDCITTTKQSTTQPCAYFLWYTVCYIIQTPSWGLRSMGLLLDTYRCLTCTLYCVLFLLHWHVWLISLLRPYLAVGNVLNNFFVQTILCCPKTRWTGSIALSHTKIKVIDYLLFHHFLSYRRLWYNIMQVSKLRHRFMLFLVIRYVFAHLIIINAVWLFLN